MAASKQLVVINLFAGPGVGKSTLAAELFAAMKKAGCSVELVTEYAKDLVYEHGDLSNQLDILAQQNNRLRRLAGQVDFAITDSPLLTGLVYTPRDYLPKHFRALALELFHEYTNVNFVLTRNLDARFREEGRVHTEAESIAADIRIENILQASGIAYRTLPSHNDGLLGYIMAQMRKGAERVPSSRT